VFLPLESPEAWPNLLEQTKIAQQMVPLLKPFGVEIWAFSPSVPDAVLQERGVKRSPSVEDLFSQNDVIVELAPYHAKNHQIVTESLLRSIAAGGAFINIGRGKVVREEVLFRVARGRENDLQIVLIMHNKESLPQDSPLREIPNVALLPHIAWPTKDRRCASASLAIAKLKRFT